VNGAGTKTHSNKIRVVALGTLSKHKGADLLQMLLTRVRRQDMELHFYGRAVEGYGYKLSRLGLQCHGPYKPSDIPAIMSSSDIGLVLSIWEDNGPQVAMEFINHKTPVLGTRRGGIPDIVSPDSGHLFDPDRVDDVDKAVQWLQEITVGEIRRISAGIHSLKTPDQHARRISTLYQEALNVLSRQPSTLEPDRGVAGRPILETDDLI
jgi:glycosyltransferase involved in cell wall biosynthesis